MARNASRIAPLALVALLSGCASTPSSQFYSVDPVAQAAGPASDVVVVVGPVTVPSAVDRPQIVVTVGPNQVQLDEFNRWAAPLQDEITSALTGDLVVLLGTPSVTTLAHGAVDGAQFRVSVEVQGFESQPGVAATLDAAWTVRRMKDGKVESGRTNAREPATQPGYAAIAAAHSRAVGRLSQDIANAVRSLAAAGR